MSETTPGETPVERRLRRVEQMYRTVPGMCATREEQDETVAALDAGREALALLREFDEADWNEWIDKRRALLARCEGDR